MFLAAHEYNIPFDIIYSALINYKDSSNHYGNEIIYLNCDVILTRNSP